MAAEGNSPDQTTTTATPENVEALLEAARYDDIDDIESLSSSGLSLDSKDSFGRTALHMASANGHLDVVEYLIGRGVDPIKLIVCCHIQSPSIDLNASNEEKNTPLHWACLNGHIEVVKKLILAGANVSALNCHERTPMDEAVSRGKMDVIDAINTAVAVLEVTSISVS